MNAPKTLSALAVPLDIEPMEAKLVDELPEGDWQYEPKWDGFRCLAFKAGGEVDLKAKSGKPLARYFPEMVETLKRLSARSFVLDGELAIVSGGEFSFDALLQRIHPADSRIKRLAAETPAIFILFDLLLDASGKNLIEAPLTMRRPALETFFASAKQEHALKLSPYTLSRAEAERWLKQGGTALDGVVAKLRDGPYVPGERAMMKVKQHRTADCVVGGFRYRSGSNEVGSLLLGLYDYARQARPCRLHGNHRQQGPRRADGEARSPGRSARLHRKGARRTKPLEHRALGAMATAEAQARGRNLLRPGHGQSLPSRHQARALPSRQAPQSMHARADRAYGKTGKAHRRHAEILRRLDPLLDRRHAPI